MPTPSTSNPRALAVGATLILLELALTLAAAYAVLVVAAWLLGGPLEIHLAWAARLVGVVGVGAGVAVGADTFRYRDPRTMLLSTSVTLRKMFARTPVENRGERTEPFVAVGPYRYSRNPLYLSVLLLVVGFGVLDASVLPLLWSVVLLGWYSLVLIPFEERELLALFGGSYARYRENVPMLVPYRRGYRGSGRSP